MKKNKWKLVQTNLHDLDAGRIIIERLVQRGPAKVIFDVDAEASIEQLPHTVQVLPLNGSVKLWIILIVCDILLQLDNNERRMLQPLYSTYFVQILTFRKLLI